MTPPDPAVPRSPQQEIAMMQIVPGSERWYCRVEGCAEFTAGNEPFGRCAMHALEHLGGAIQPDKGFPPIGSPTTPALSPDPRTQEPEK